MSIKKLISKYLVRFGAVKTWCFKFIIIFSLLLFSLLLLLLFFLLLFSLLSVIIFFYFYFYLAEEKQRLPENIDESRSFIVSFDFNLEHEIGLKKIIIIKLLLI
jgi:ABC-type bacteriocin/lantibiotic exporter with double-glycine peptidase domain